jgi:hypothetical protein
MITIALSIRSSKGFCSSPVFAGNSRCTEIPYCLGTFQGERTSRARQNPASGKLQDFQQHAPVDGESWITPSRG